MPVFAKFFRDLDVADTPTIADVGEPIISGMSWMPKGYYAFAGQTYDCTRAGCYRFWDTSQKTIKTRLVHAYPGRIEPDLYGFLSGLCWNSIHDLGDHKLAGRTLAEAGHDHVWRLKCGHITRLALWFLRKWNYTARQINLSTQDPQWAVMNGHIVIEVKHEAKWRLFDLTKGVYFTGSNGAHLSAAEIVSAGVLNCTRVRMTAEERRGAAYSGGWCSMLNNDVFHRADPDAWFARIYQSWEVGTG